MKRIGIIFGAPDIEHQEALSVALELCSRGLLFCVAQATFRGETVSISQANKADGFDVVEGNVDFVEEWLLFECRVDGIDPVCIFDHHREGDPGFDKSHEEYWEGSSLGQFMNYFELKPTEEQLLVAAGDHNPMMAYQGFCPGVDPEKLFDYRLKKRSEFFKKIGKTNKETPELLRGVIEKAVEDIKKNAFTLGGFLDLRHIDIDELEEAALFAGLTIMFCRVNRDEENQRTGFKQLCLNGASEESVDSFVNYTSSIRGAKNPYQNKFRGYARITVPE